VAPGRRMTVPPEDAPVGYGRATAPTVERDPVTAQTDLPIVSFASRGACEVWLGEYHATSDGTRIKHRAIDTNTGIASRREPP
jgi:hypothetical protein